ncbi:hypothetical protein GCK72_003840 [Caenorhabditis remanei]|uniref:Uncharacterized protein n=1 Tax=Caenorhabditis remanei TaxID=31234 RepID=A0A6A5HAN4_CAERE|nr:hypothetical protein GCK72_003840 [Caenorhabditis remanei]KAF1763894.1 hypothetical protein GCK72_003840 [Caenorhabditis remanei]
MAPPYNPYPYADKNHLKIPDVFPTMHVLRGFPAYIPLPFHDTYRRVRTNSQNKKYEHIYKTCSGNNCGFWMNVKNNKTVPAGRTEFNIYLGKLVVENIRQHDAGMYMTGDRNNSIMVYTLKGIL